MEFARGPVFLGFVVRDVVCGVGAQDFVEAFCDDGFLGGVVQGAGVLADVEPGLVVYYVFLEGEEVEGEVGGDALEHPGEGYVCHA